MASPLDAAIEYWRRGLCVIPIPRPQPGVPADAPGGGKVPAISWRAYQHRRSSEDELRAWFSKPQNIAIVTGGISGVVVIDADSPEAVRWVTKRLPYSPWQTLTARGYHVWYRHPGVRVGNRARLETRDGRIAIDVRGDGGYVIAPGSIHASGTRYEYAGDWTADKASLPIFWPGWLVRPERHDRPRPIQTRPTGAVIDRARRYLARIPRPEIGQGSDVNTLYAACRIARGFGIDEATTVSLLEEWAAGRPGWTRAWLAIKVRSALKYGREPLGALR